MGRLLISTESKIEGPWLLEREELEELDKLINAFSEKLNEAYNKQVEKTEAENGRNGLFTVKMPLTWENNNYGIPQIELISSDEKKLIDNSIKGILKDAKVQDFSPQELSIKIDFGHPDNEFKMSVVSGIEGYIEYKIKCFDEDILEEMKYEFDKWTDKYKPKKITQIWSYFYTLIMIVGFLTLLVLWTNLYDTPSNFNTQLNKEAHKLIEKGINENNINEAITLSLKLQSDYVPKNFKSEEVLNQNSLRVFIITALAFIALAFCPRTTIGIGRNVFKVKFYRYWIFLTMTYIPSSFFLPKIIEFIHARL